MSAETVNLLAQALGIGGFAVIIVSTRMSTRPSLLAVDVMGLVPVALHYVMLGALAGALKCAIYIVMDIIAVGTERSRKIKLSYYAVYPVATVLFAFVYESPLDLLAYVGTMIAVASRQQTNLVRLKILIAVSTSLWLLYGIAVGSIGQVIFSSLYGVSAVYSAWRTSRLRRAPSSASTQ